MSVARHEDDAGDDKTAQDVSLWRLAIRQEQAANRSIRWTRTTVDYVAGRSAAEDLYSSIPASRCTLDARRRSLVLDQAS